MFAHSLAGFTDRTAMITEDHEVISYQDLAQRADNIFNIEGAPEKNSSLIAIECANKLDTIYGYLGALRQGVPALLVDAELDLDLKSRLLRHYNVSHCWGVEGQWIEYEGVEGPEVHPDVAILLSTSGSTGAPKLVRLTLKNLRSNAASIAQYLGLDHKQRPITTLPLHYSYGLSVLNSHLMIGATIILTGQPVTSRAFWDLLKKQRATSFAGVPATYKMIKQLRFERMDLPSLQMMTQAGGRLDPDIVRWYGELTLSREQKFVVMYGQTEATARISYVPPEKLLDKVGSIGRVIPDGVLELVDEKGNLIEEIGEVGELRYTGPNVMMGYANNVKDLALPDTQNGVLSTGDLAWRDHDGYFFIAGRLKRFIKIFGNRISLDEVEGNLREKGFDVAVTGIDDLMVIAVITASVDDEEKLMLSVTSKYHLHHSAIRVERVDTFPHSSSGKIKYTDLLSQFLPSEGI